MSRCVGMFALGLISDREFSVGDGESGEMNVFKFMVVALAGWMNQQQQDVIEYLREENTTAVSAITGDWKTGSSSLSSDWQKKGRWAAAGGLGVCFATTTGMRHEIDDPSFWTLLTIPKQVQIWVSPLALKNRHLSFTERYEAVSESSVRGCGFGVGAGHCRSVCERAAGHLQVTRGSCAGVA